MMKTLFIVFVIVTTCFYNSVGLQGCVEYNASTPGGPPTFCSGSIKGLYFANDIAQPQMELENLALMRLQGSNPGLFSTLAPLLPPSCGKALKDTICMTVFPSCAKIDPYFVDPTVVQPLNFTDEVECAVQVNSRGKESYFEDGQCFEPLPKYSCRSETCQPVGTSKITSVCPLISGKFLNHLSSVSSARPDLDLDEAVARAENDVATANILSLLNLSPNCAETIEAGGVELSLFPGEEQSFFKTLIDVQIQKLGDTSSGCGPEDNREGIDCADVREVYGCQSPNDVELGRTYDVAAPNSVCSSFVSRESLEESATFTQSVLARIDAGGDQECFDARFETNKGAYFVPTFPGLAPLGSRIEGSVNEVIIPDKDFEQGGACSNQAEEGPKFTNFEKTPLCSGPRGEPLFNSRDCLLATVESKISMLPKVAPLKCHAAYNELICGTAQMKLEAKSLCLVGTCADFDNYTAAFEEHKVGWSFLLPRLPSRNICTRFEQECGPFLSGINVTGLVNCSGTVEECNDPFNTWGCSNPIAGKEQYPEAATIFLENPGSLPFIAETGVDVGKIFETSVVQPTTEKQVDLTEQLDSCSCPYPLLVPDDAEAETLPGLCCQVPCRGTMYSEDSYEQYTRVQLVVAGLGVICASFLVLTWSFREKKQQFMVFWMAVCSFNVSWPLFLMAVVAVSQGSLEDVHCKSNTEPYSMDDGLSLCVLQAAWLMFFGLALCCWWFCQAMDLFRKLVLGVRHTGNSKYKYHLFCWTLPTVMSVVNLSLRAYGFSAPVPYCFMNDSIETWYEWATFYGWVALMLIFGTFAMLGVLFVIFRHASRTKGLKYADGGSTTGSKNKWTKNWKLYRTPFTFVLAFLIIWTQIFCFRLIATFQEEQYVEEGKAWISCLITNYLLGSPDPAIKANFTAMLQDYVEPGQQLEGCGVVQPGGLPTGLKFSTFIFVMGQSFVAWLVFGPLKENFRLWAFKCGCSEKSGVSTGRDISSRSENSSFKTGYSASRPGSFVNSLTMGTKFSMSRASLAPKIEAPKDDPPEAPLSPPPN